MATTINQIKGSSVSQVPEIIKLEATATSPSTTSNPFVDAIEGNVEGLITGLSATDNNLNGVSSTKDGNNINYPSHQPVAEVARMFYPESIDEVEIAAKGTAGIAAIKPIKEEVDSSKEASLNPEAMFNEEAKTNTEAAQKAHGTSVGINAQVSDFANGHNFVVGTTAAGVVANEVSLAGDSTVSMHAPITNILAQHVTTQANISSTLVTGQEIVRATNSHTFVDQTIFQGAEDTFDLARNTKSSLSTKFRDIAIEEHTALSDVVNNFGDTKVLSFSPEEVESTAGKKLLLESFGTATMIAVDVGGFPASSESPAAFADKNSKGKGKGKDSGKKAATKAEEGKSTEQSTAGLIDIISITKETQNYLNMNGQGVKTISSRTIGSFAVYDIEISAGKNQTAVAQVVYFSGNPSGGYKVLGGKSFIGNTSAPIYKITPPELSKPPVMPEMPAISSSLDNCIPSKYKEGAGAGASSTSGSEAGSSTSGSNSSKANPVAEPAYSLPNPVKMPQTEETATAGDKSPHKHAIPTPLSPSSAKGATASSSSGESESTYLSIAKGCANIGGPADIFCEGPSKKGKDSVSENVVESDIGNPPVGKVAEEGIDVEAFIDNGIGGPTTLEEYLDLVQDTAKVITSDNQAADAYRLSTGILTNAVKNNELSRVINSSSGLVNTVLTGGSSQDIRKQAENFVLSEVTRFLPSNLQGAAYEIKDLIFRLQQGNISPDQLVNNIGSILSSVTGVPEINTAVNLYNNVRGIVTSVQRGDYQSLLSGQVSGTLAPLIGGENAAKVQAVMDTVLAGINAGKAIAKLPELLKLMDQYKIPALEQAALILQCTDLFNQIMNLFNSIKDLLNAFDSDGEEGERNSNSSRSNYNPFNSRNFSPGGRGLGTYLVESLPRIIQIGNTVNNIRNSPNLEFIEDPYLVDALAEITGINLDYGLTECFKAPTLTLSQSDINIIRVEQNRLYFSMTNTGIYNPAQGDIIEYRVAYFSNTSTGDNLFPYQNDKQYTPSVYKYSVVDYNPIDNIGVALFTPTTSFLILQRADGALLEYVNQAIGIRLKPFIIDAYIAA